MARTPTESGVEQFTDSQQENKELALIQQENNTVAAADAVIMASFDVIKSVGRIETAQFYATVADKLIAETALNIRESKQYKGLPYKDKNGNTRQVAHFEEFCTAFLGKSVRRVQELMNNLSQLGPELYEQAEKLGFRQRDYNALKVLPDDDKRLIMEAIESESLESALDLMQQMAARHQRQKEEAAKKLEESAKTLEAKDMLIQKKDEKINDLDEKLNRKLIDDATLPPGYAQKKELDALTREITATITARLRAHIIQLFNEFDDQPNHIRLAAAQSIGQVITASYDLAADMGLTLELDPDKAANDPAKQDAEDFMAWQAEQDAIAASAKD